MHDVYQQAVLSKLFRGYCSFITNTLKPRVSRENITLTTGTSDRPQKAKPVSNVRLANRISGFLGLLSNEILLEKSTVSDSILKSCEKAKMNP